MLTWNTEIINLNNNNIFLYDNMELQLLYFHNIIL